MIFILKFQKKKTVKQLIEKKEGDRPKQLSLALRKKKVEAHFLFFFF